MAGSFADGKSACFEGEAGSLSFVLISAHFPLSNSVALVCHSVRRSGLVKRNVACPPWLRQSFSPQPLQAICGYFSPRSFQDPRKSGESEKKHTSPAPLSCVFSFRTSLPTRIRAACSSSRRSPSLNRAHLPRVGMPSGFSTGSRKDSAGFSWCYGMHAARGARISPSA
jgi:hypothetical protein